MVPVMSMFKSILFLCFSASELLDVQLCAKLFSEIRGFIIKKLVMIQSIVYREPLFSPIFGTGYES